MKRAKASTALARRRKAADVLPEYDFSRARRNKYASRYAKGAMAVTLDPDVAVVFRGASAVNTALRTLARARKKRHGAPTRPRRKHGERSRAAPEQGTHRVGRGRGTVAVQFDAVADDLVGGRARDSAVPKATAEPITALAYVRDVVRFCAPSGARSLGLTAARLRKPA